MKISTAIKQLLTGACIYYTVVFILILGINLLIKGSLEAVVIEVGNVLLLLPFGLAMSAADLIRKHTSLSGGIRRGLHFFITLFSFYLFLWLPLRAGNNFSAHVIAIFLISLLYWGIILITYLVGKRFHSLREE